MQIEQLATNAQKEITSAGTLAELMEIRVRYLGKKGEVTLLLKSLKDIAPEERKEFGAKVNVLKNQISDLIEAKKVELEEASIEAAQRADKIDVTLPGRRLGPGTIHPITRARRRMEDIFQKAGYEIARGPEVETEYYNFDALNIPPHHPARADHDTFYCMNEHLLRTHTSPVQIRAMEKSRAPIRIIAPGRVYRCDYDVTHVPMFTQIEGLLVDKDINFSHLKGTLKFFLESFFETTLDMRLRASYFPFTEPSVEIDITCVHCRQKGCPSCKGSGWLEVTGAGMVHPKVLESVGIDSKVYKGFAFGAGIERLAMLKYRIKDIRELYAHDLRFFRAFGA